VIEHHMDVIKCADWVIDLGPEGGDRGGTVVAQGTPEDVARVAGSYTGRYLKDHLPAVSEKKKTPRKSPVKRRRKAQPAGV
jgi:excinuclease ABC subunit A